MASESSGPQQAPPRQPWEARIREAAFHVETDLRKLVTYLNDEVMPDVRRNGSSALRSAAAELQRLAERMDESSRGGAPPPPPSAPRP